MGRDEQKKKKIDRKLRTDTFPSALSNRGERRSHRGQSTPRSRAMRSQVTMKVS